MKSVQGILPLQKTLTNPWVSVLLFGSLLTGCAGNSEHTPVVDRPHSTAPVYSNPESNTRYRVQRGDTLYSLAARFGWDWRKLAENNGIGAPYTIVPGQTIVFTSGSTGTNVAQTTATNPTVSVIPARQPITTTVSKPTPIATTPKKSLPPVAASGQGKWLWPANGALVGLFSSNTSLNKGIDIAGQLGQPVIATAAGSVVYAGSGLHGYGELVIIKHNDTFISAYGHNRRLLVNEGQQVAAGQQIAEMGSTGTDGVKLHFEIRRQGKPVDPLQYLPKQ